MEGRGNLGYEVLLIYATPTPFPIVRTIYTGAFQNFDNHINLSCP